MALKVSFKREGNEMFEQYLPENCGAVYEKVSDLPDEVRNSFYVFISVEHSAPFTNMALDTNAVHRMRLLQKDGEELLKKQSKAIDFVTKALEQSSGFSGLKPSPVGALSTMQCST